MSDKKPVQITAADIRALLRERYSDHRQYVCAEEVGNATGLEHRRRMDFVAVNAYRSNGYSIEGIEIKVSKSDLRRELQDSSKHNIFFSSIDYYSLAAPEDIIDMKIIPPKWGVYAVKVLPDGSLRMYARRNPLSLHDERSPDIARPFFASLLRAISSQTATPEQIKAARKEGAEQERFLHRSDVGRIARLEDELKAFHQLMDKFSLWGSGSVERGMERYEQYQNVNLASLVPSLEGARERISKAIEAIEKGSNGNEQQ